jgi:hypothetical protein
MVFLVVVYLPLSYYRAGNDTAVPRTRIGGEIAKFRIVALDYLELLSQVKFKVLQTYADTVDVAGRATPSTAVSVGAAVVLFALAQAVPYGRNHENPPVQAEPIWDSPRTRQLAKRACFDCHSNETTWPWYTNFAPFSWLAYNDVTGGRSALNFSEWNRPQD